MENAITRRQQAILAMVAQQASASISQIHAHLPENPSTATLNRDLATLVAQGYLLKTGKGRATAYRLSPAYSLFAPLDETGYFDTDPDKRESLRHFNHDLLLMLRDTPLLTTEECRYFEDLKAEYQHNIATISPALYQKEMERLTIELSWKSSQIEGNTYSLLETERLFKEHQTAQGKSQEEATMLLNHKTCLNFILSQPDIGNRLNLALMETLHSLLVEGLGINRNLRSRMVGITGTAYQPLDNIFQIREAIDAMCATINAKQNEFERALLGVMLVSYIQPFEDGNKRTARMISNALLIAAGACPLSYRSVDSLEYKKAMLIFYEQNNLSAFKQLFSQQVEFAVKNYFR